MTARVTDVTRARDAQRAHDVANIATQMADVPTSGDVLLALSRAWDAGHRDGFNEGFERGQKAAASAIEAVQGLMP